MQASSRGGKLRTASGRTSGTYEFRAGTVPHTQLAGCGASEKFSGAKRATLGRASDAASRPRASVRSAGAQSLIDGVKIIPLKQIVDERGKVMHMLKASDPHFLKFGEIYFSCAWPGTVKAWHVHKSMTLNNAVVSGRAKLVLYDSRPGSPTRGEVQEIFLGEDNYVLVQIPPGITNGYKAYGDTLVILANCATEPHDPDEIVHMDPFTKDIPYDWGLKHG